MIDRQLPSLHSWRTRWGRLARAVGIGDEEKLTVALSGGADSVLLLHLLADAHPRPAVRAVHVDHGLRGEEARADARFCRNLCRGLGVPFAERRLALDPALPSLEARARRARYAVLIDACRASGHRTLLTGHHSDDALETLLLRWIRGTSPEGLRGPRPVIEMGTADPGAPPVRVVRPLLSLRREEVRRLLSDRGLRWREDRSNRDPRFARNRLRHGFLPALRGLCGDEGIENLRAFGRAVEGLEDRLAAATAHLSWGTPRYGFLESGGGGLETDGAGSSRPLRSWGGVLPRAALMGLAGPLRRRALWRLLVEGTGHAPPRRLLAILLRDLGAGRCARHSLPGGWTLWMRSAELHLLAPPTAAPRDGGARQPTLPFPTPPGAAGPGPPVARLPVPGILTLEDGRRLSAEVLRRGPGVAPPAGGFVVELDARCLPGVLEVRYPWPGARFRPLGAPGSRRLVRFLADRGVPRELRARIPLVTVGEDVLWVAGFEPGDPHRVRPTTTFRLRLALHDLP